jgi:ligand-binding sensor domain-containing protein
MLKKISFLLLANLAVQNISAQGLHDWQVMTNMNDVTAVQYFNHEVWVGSGGGVYRFRTADSTWQIYNNLDGLKSLDISAATADRYGNLLFACRDGIINFYNPLQDDWHAYTNMEEQNIRDIHTDTSSVWVATNQGVGVFESAATKLIFRDFYNNFTVNPEKGYGIAVFNNFVFYATQHGLLYASANYKQDNLKIAGAWAKITTAQGLPADVVLDLTVVDSILYVATTMGVAWLDKSFILHQENSWELGYVNRIISDQTNLYFVQNNQYYLEQNGQWVLQQTLDRNISSGALDDNGELWLGLVTGGLRKSNWLKSFKIDGPGSNHVGVVIKDRQGQLWMTSGKFKLTYGEGFYKYDFKRWTNYKFTGDPWVRKNQTDFVYEDRLGRIWIGAWGGGATVISGDDVDYYHGWAGDGGMIISTPQAEQQMIMPEVPEAKRSCLVGAAVSGSETYTVIPYFQEDAEQHLWIVNHYARIPEYLAVLNNSNSGIPSCVEWTYVGDNVGMTLDESQVSCLEFETTSAANRVWMGTWNSGILILDYGADIENVNDDQLYRIDMNSDNLFSNTILALQQDQDGIIWIGTSAGLNSYQNDADGTNRRVYKHVGDIGPVENKINYIFVDAYNNKWFATDGGLSILQAGKSPWDPAAWVHYTTENSGLPSPIINSIFVDNQSGAAYLGTELGLVIFRGAFSQFRSDLREVVGGPNPFLLDGSKEFVIKNLVPNSTVKILNINGHLVRELTASGGEIDGSRATWNGKDVQNKWVPSGIYLYLIFNEEGLKNSGKISVIKP